MVGIHARRALQELQRRQRLEIRRVAVEVDIVRRFRHCCCLPWIWSNNRKQRRIAELDPESLARWITGSSMRGSGHDRHRFGAAMPFGSAARARSG